MKALLHLVLVSTIAAWSTGASALEMEETAIVFGEPGVVIFDSVGPKKLFPLPTTVREFATEEAYEAFLVDELNALITDESGVPMLKLHAIQPDYSYYYDADLGFRRVDDALLLYIGGLEGKIIIGGRDVCVDSLRCGDSSPASFEVKLLDEVNLVVYAHHARTVYYTEDQTEITAIQEIHHAGVRVDDFEALLRMHNKACTLCSWNPNMAGCVVIDCEWDHNDPLTDLLFGTALSWDLPLPDVTYELHLPNRGSAFETEMQRWKASDIDDIDDVLYSYRGKAEVWSTFTYGDLSVSAGACDGPGCILN